MTLSRPAWLNAIPPLGATPSSYSRPPSRDHRAEHCRGRCGGLPSGRPPPRHLLRAASQESAPGAAAATTATTAAGPLGGGAPSHPRCPALRAIPGPEPVHRLCDLARRRGLSGLDPDVRPHSAPGGRGARAAPWRRIPRGSSPSWWPKRPARFGSGTCVRYKVSARKPAMVVAYLRADEATVAAEPLSDGLQKPTRKVPDCMLPAVADRGQPRRPWLREKPSPEAS